MMTIEEAFLKAEELFKPLEATAKQSLIRRTDGTIGHQCDVGFWTGETYRAWGGSTFEEAFQNIANPDLAMPLGPKAEKLSEARMRSLGCHPCPCGCGCLAWIHKAVPKCTPCSNGFHGPQNYALMEGRRTAE